jgi:hypothetical protein
MHAEFWQRMEGLLCLRLAAGIFNGISEYCAWFPDRPGCYESSHDNQQTGLHAT